MYLISGCLLGHNCKYNGGNNLNEDVVEFSRTHSYLVVCPESASGLPVPRPPAEHVEQADGSFGVFDKTGKDVTREFIIGTSKEFLRAYEESFRRGETIEGAILKANSPSCGSGEIYDGTFTGNKALGDGIFTSRLKDMGIPVYTEHNFKEQIK